MIDNYLNIMNESLKKKNALLDKIAGNPAKTGRTFFSGI